ncbi:hypothetical protein, partial [Rhizorhabdus wittichii]|uniref:hypothetical protein n=1 Tax=Rhizorhabdus wittichii TaxID=160791 RepID=UPI0004985C4F
GARGARAPRRDGDRRREGGDRGPRRDRGDRGDRPRRERSEGGDEGPAPDFAPAFLTRDDD